MARIVPLTGTNIQRLKYAALGLLKTNELHTTKDQKRAFLENTYLGGVWHGAVASEAAMLALHSTATRGCWTLDMCKRSDLEGSPLYVCTGDNGKLTTNWEPLGTGGSSGGAVTAVDVTYDNTASGLTATDVQAALDEIVDAIEAGVAGAQPLDADLTAIAAQGVSAWGLARMADSGATAAKAALGITRADIGGASAVGRNLLAVESGTTNQLPRINANGSITLIDVPSGGGGGLVYIADGDIPLGGVTRPCAAWSSDPDANGVVYQLATNFGAVAWANPHTAGAVTVVLSSGWGIGTAAEVVDRAAGDNVYSKGTAPGDWLAIDLKGAIALVSYSLRSRTQLGYRLRNWRIQGSNSVSENTVDGIEAATWSDLDVRVNDTTIANTANAWGHFSLGAPPAAYRWFRLLSTGLDSSGGYFLTIAEMEVYATAYTATLPRTRPAGSRCWLTDGEYYIPAW